MSSPADLFARAWQLHQANDFPEAERLYRQVLEVDPANADAWCFLGAVRQAVGKLAEAEAHFREALRLIPNYATAQNCLGIVLAQQGKLSEAAGAFEQLLRDQPADAQGHNNLGLVQVQRGYLDAAIASYQRALQLQPDYPTARANLELALRQKTQAVGAPVGFQGNQEAGRIANERGIALAHQGKYEEAIAAFLEGQRLRPDDANIVNNLGNIFYYQTRGGEAIDCYRQALALRPDYPEAHNNLGTILLELGEIDEALDHCREAVRLRPTFAGAHSNLGSALRDKGQLDEAVASYQEVLRYEPDSAEMHANLAALLQVRGRKTEADAHAQAALRLQPEIRGKLATLFLKQNLVDAAREQLQHMEAPAARRVCLDYLEGLLFTARIEAYDTVLNLARSLFPHDAALEAAALFRCHFDETVAPPELVRRQVEWVRTFYPAATPPAARSRRDGEKLRLVYVGTYLHFMIMKSVFRWHDYDRFDITLITNDRRSDLAGLFPQIRLHRFTGTDVVRLCRELGADLAIDLVGPLPFRDGLAQFAAFQERLAPVQASWVGRHGTTGSPAYDYIIADWQLIGPEEEDLYTERPARLPEVSLCWTPPQHAPEPGPLPALRNGAVTFGSANRGFKMNTALLRAWAKVLERCPGSRLAIKGLRPTDADFLEQLQRVFRQHGIAAERIVTTAYPPSLDYMHFYRDIDISLDTYPYTGGLTTLDSLWMGVPVVSRSGRALLSRTSRSILAHLGCSQWLSGSEEEYVNCACELAARPDRLAEVRASLRPLVQRSLLCNEQLFTRQLEALFVAMVNSAGKQPVAVGTSLPSR